MLKDVVLGAVMAEICINIQTMQGFEPNKKVELGYNLFYIAT